MKHLSKYLLSGLLLLSAVQLDAQSREIRETVTRDFVPTDTPMGRKSAMGSRKIGVQSLLSGAYRDSIVRYFDKIEAFCPSDKDTVVNHYYRAVFGQDTLCFRERKREIIRHYAGKPLLEVESLLAPYQRFSVEIDGLEEPAITELIRTMQQMKTADALLNNEQTCIFYALNLLLDVEGIDPAPVITRNTTFTNGHQLNAFFDHLLTEKGSYPCRYKVLQHAEFPDNCVLVFRNARHEYIHAVFYRKDTGEFYTKNGSWAPVVLQSLRPLTERYGRYDTRARNLSREGLDGLADTVIVYTLN